MVLVKNLLSVLIVIGLGGRLSSQSFSLKSPDEKIEITVSNSNVLEYVVKFNNYDVVEPSQLGFEFENEPVLNRDFEILNYNISEVNESWEPVVKYKHAMVLNHFKELTLRLKEKSGLQRRLDVFFRAYNDGVAFRYKLYGSQKIGARKIVKELSQFNIPDNPTSWIANYGKYSSHQQDEFHEKPLNEIKETSIIGLPLLMSYKTGFWVAITEANIDNYPGFYIGENGGRNNILTTKLAPLPGEKEQGVKVRFSEELYTPWRVLMIGESPGALIESEIIQNLNEPCAIEDTDWIKPGMSAWDHWWSGNVKMDMTTIKQYIDLASNMGWEYMMIDWQWYGKYNTPNADITKAAPQLDMPEIINYANNKNVRLFLWLHSTDVNRNSAYKEAFKLYNSWGIAGVKIDFMNRDDQEMVNWYHDIIKEAAKNKLLVNFHGAYKPDGIIRTYPNMITREGVMGNELNKFSKKYHLSAEHNVKLAFTRMLAGQMDFTPGGFLNVTAKTYKKQVPALVMCTRAGELAKFVVYESPLTVVCDHPKHYLDQPGSDFLKMVPTVWDDTKFLGGHPNEYIAIARKNNTAWFVGALNNSKQKHIEIPLNFLDAGSYEAIIWQDAKKSNKQPTFLNQRKVIVNNEDTLEVYLAENGGCVVYLKKIN